MNEPGFGKEAPAKGGPLFRIEGVRLHVWPIGLALILGLGLPVLAGLLLDVVQHFVPLPERPLYPWIEFFYEHAAQLALTLFVISVMKPLVRADYGLHGPRGKSYFGAAIFWGLVLGVLMTLADYWHDIVIQHAPPQRLFEPTPINIAGWLSYQGVFLAISDETLWRGLLVTYLATQVPGRIYFFRKNMGIAGIVVAAIFALSFTWDFVAYPIGIALAKVLVAFLQGVFFAYWFEKSKSLAAPIIGHGVCFGVSQILIFAMVAFWI